MPVFILWVYPYFRPSLSDDLQCIITQPWNFVTNMIATCMRYSCMKLYQKCGKCCGIKKRGKFNSKLTDASNNT